MSSPQSKNILLSISANQKYKPTRLIPEEGRRPSSLYVGMGCGGRGQRQALLAPDEALFAYGEVVWSWRRDAGAKPLRSKLLGGDGGKQARSPGRARSKP
jgi:hypothetical protein